MLSPSLARGSGDLLRSSASSRIRSGGGTRRCRGTSSIRDGSSASGGGNVVVLLVDGRPRRRTVMVEVHRQIHDGC